jgi:hypothetical protein
VLEGQPLDQSYGQEPAKEDVPTVQRGTVPKKTINAAQGKLFWDTAKTMGKTPEQVNNYLGSIGVEQTMVMLDSQFPAAYAWAGSKQ